MKISRVILVLLVMCQITFGQTTHEKLVHGKITADSVSVNGIKVLNLVNQKTTFTSKDGEFFILAKASDVLVFSAVNLESNRLEIGYSEVMSELLSIKMFAKITKLSEVIVHKNQFSVLSLGIVNKAPVKYSPAERKLQTAGDFKPIMLLGLLAGSMELDPLINKINGRTKKLKKLVVLEKKERNVKLISELYDDEYFTNRLGIAAEYVNGFIYYVVENDNFLEVLEAKNKEKTSFYLVSLAQKYKALLNEESPIGFKK